MTATTLPNSANGRIVRFISALACTTTGFTVSVPEAAATTVKPVVMIGAGCNRPFYVAAATGWAELNADLTRWAALPHDWDGMEGTPPAQGSIDAAGALLAKLQAAHVPHPEATVAGDGEISYTWSYGSSFASVSFLSDGHIVAYSRVPGHETVEIDEIASDEVDLSGLIESLRDLA